MCLVALLAAKATAANVQSRCNLHESFFNALSRDARTLDDRIRDAITAQSALLQRLVGTAAYTDSETEPRHTCIKTAEELRAAAQVCEEMATDIAGVGTVVLEPDADPALLLEIADRYREQADQFLSPYITAEDEVGTRLLHSLATTGIDETERDVYADIDFGELEDNR